MKLKQKHIRIPHFKKPFEIENHEFKMESYFRQAHYQSSLSRSLDFLNISDQLLPFKANNR